MATWTLACDAAEPQQLAQFWAQALGYVIEPGFDAPHNASIIDPTGQGPAIRFLRVRGSKTSRNRVHIDVRVMGETSRDPVEREQLILSKIIELVELGASVLRVKRDGDVLDHIVMTDPEGNEFRVA